MFSESLAAAALDGNLSLLSNMGSTRDVFLADGTVYKVETLSGANLAEWEGYKALSDPRTDLPEDVRVPRTELFYVGPTPVIAMEYVEGTAIGRCYCLQGLETCEASCMTLDEQRALSSYVADIGGLNVIRATDGTYWLIDLAMW